ARLLPQQTALLQVLEKPPAQESRNSYLTKPIGRSPLMLRTLGLSAVLFALFVAGSSSALGQRASTPTLKGTVGPSFTISLTKAGKAVKSLKAGTYKVTVSDKSSMHNFTLERE